MKNPMDFLADWVGALVRLALWLLWGTLALGLLGLALVVLVVGAVWALLRGQRPRAPVIVGRFTPFTSARAWRSAGWPRPDAAGSSDVIDVEGREVSSHPGRTLPPQP